MVQTKQESVGEQYESSNMTFEEEDAMILFEDENNSENKLKKHNPLYIEEQEHKGDIFD
jgi:hypothetical protein